MGRPQNLDSDVPRLTEAIRQGLKVEIPVFQTYHQLVSHLVELEAFRNDPKNSVEVVKSCFSQRENLSLDDVCPDFQYDIYQLVYPSSYEVRSYLFSPHERLALHTKIGRYLLKQVKTVFPPVLWLPQYKLGWLALDLICGVTIGVLGVAQGLAYAALGGLPPYYGLYSFLVPCFTYALFSSSRRVSFGPTTIVMILTLQTCSTIANPDTQPALYVQVALSLALLKGIWTTAAGILRLGFIVDLLGTPVLSGFITAAGLVIASTQLKSFFGIAAPRTTDFIPSMIAWAQYLPTTNWQTFVLAMICMVVLIAAQIVNEKLPIYVRGYRFPIPGALIVTVFATLASWAANLSQYGVKVIGYIPPGMPSPTYPNFEYFSQLVVPSIVISVICYMETIAVARKEAAERGFKINGTQELMAQGLANLFGSFTSAPPGTGSLSRTAVVMNSGAETQVYQIVVGLVMIFTLEVASPALAYTPYSALSAIVISAVYGLFEFSLVPKLWFTKKLDVFCWLFTFILTLVTSLEVGILAGWAVSLLVFVFERSRTSMELLGRVPETEIFVERKRYASSLVTPGLSILRINGDLFFGNSHRLAPALLKIATKERTRVLVLDVGAVVDIDYTALANFRIAFDALRKAQVRILFGRVHGKMRDFMHKTGMAEKLGEENFFIALPDAVRRAQILLIDGQVEASQALEKQFDQTIVPVQNKKKSWDCCKRRKRQDSSLLDDMDTLTDPPLYHVQYPAEGHHLNEDDVPEHIDKGQHLTRNVHVYAHKQDEASIERENLWWKNLL